MHLFFFFGIKKHANDMLHPDVSLKLTLATATILTGCALRVTRVVTRENGESLLAVVFGILLPSLLIQVK